MVPERVFFSLSLNKGYDCSTPKPKLSFWHLKQSIQEFHGKYVLVPADKAA